MYIYIYICIGLCKLDHPPKASDPAARAAVA